MPLFKTAINQVEKLFVVGRIGIGSIGLFGFASKITKEEWGGPIFLCLFFIIYIVQAIRVAKTFHLFEDKLIIRRPFSFTNKTDQTFKIELIKEIIFRRIRGKFGGPHLIIIGKGINAGFRIEIETQERNDFIKCLTKLGIKVSSENM